MSLTNYSDLKTEIASYLARSDVTAASASIDTFIDLAEAYLNKRLRVIRMHTDVQIVTSSPDLPADFLEVFSLSHESNPKNLDYIPRAAFKRMVAGEYAGRPTAFTVAWDDGHTLLFLPEPATDYTLDLTYFAKIPALSESNTTNWLLTDYPELYLNACLYFAFKRFRSPLAADYRTLVDSDIKELNDEDERIRSGGGGMQMRISGTVV